jgi:hypothetical protein
MVSCGDATASSLVARVWGEVFAHFHAVTLKCQSSTLLFTCLASPFFGLGEFGHAIQTPVHDSCFLPGTLV